MCVWLVIWDPGLISLIFHRGQSPHSILTHLTTPHQLVPLPHPGYIIPIFPPHLHPQLAELILLFIFHAVLFTLRFEGRRAGQTGCNIRAVLLLHSFALPVWRLLVPAWATTWRRRRFYGWLFVPVWLIVIAAAASKKALFLRRMILRSVCVYCDNRYQSGFAYVDSKLRFPEVTTAALTELYLIN